MRAGLKCQGGLSSEAAVGQVMDALREQKLAQMAKSSRKICSHPGVPAFKVAHIVALAAVLVVLCHGSIQSCPGSCSEEDNFSSLHGVTWVGGCNAALSEEEVHQWKCCFWWGAGTLHTRRSPILSWSTWESPFLILVFNHGGKVFLFLDVSAGSAETDLSSELWG